MDPESGHSSLLLLLRNCYGFWAAWPRYHPRYRSADLVCHGCPAACCVCCRRRLTQHHRLCVLYDLWRCWRFIAAGYNARFFAKSARYKTLGKIALPPAIFTIGEPMAYGVPLVMNFTLAIPYIFINGIMLGIAWYLTVIGVLPRVAGVSTPAGMPIIISGFMQGAGKLPLSNL